MCRIFAIFSATFSIIFCSINGRLTDRLIGQNQPIIGIGRFQELRDRSFTNLWVPLHNTQMCNKIDQISYSLATGRPTPKLNKSDKFSKNIFQLFVSLCT